MPLYQRGGGIELGYAAITSDFTRTANTLADVTGLTTTVLVGDRPIMVEVHIPRWANSATSFGISVAILEDDVSIWAAFASTYLGAANNPPFNPRIRRAPAAGSHTYKVQAASYLSDGTKTMTIFAASSAPAFITVTER